jgi:hypothetical protein
MTHIFFPPNIRDDEVCLYAQTRNSLTNALPLSSFRPETTSRAPSFANANAVARPIPVKAPVINTTGVLTI